MKFGDKNNLNKYHFGVLIIFVLAIVFLAISYVYSRKDKPKIEYPFQGITIENASDMRIKGKTRPNQEVFAFVNKEKQNLTCITRNSFASGGAGKANENGGFDFLMAIEARTKGGADPLYLRVATPTKEYSSDECFSKNDLSDIVTFNYTREYSGPQ